MGTAMLVISVGLAASAASGAGASSPAQGPRIPTVTRLVQTFAALESDWMDGVRRHDEAAMRRPLADDFEMRTVAAPADPVPAEDWVRNALAFTLRSFRVADMAARDLGGTVLVSFRYTQAGEMSGRTQSGAFLVVDAWVQRGGTWKVVARYAAPSGDRALPGSGPPASLPKKY